MRRIVSRRGEADVLSGSTWDGALRGMEKWEKTLWFRIVEWCAVGVAAGVTAPTLIAANHTTASVVTVSIAAAAGGPIAAYLLMLLAQWAFIAPRRQRHEALAALDIAEASIREMTRTPDLSSEIRVVPSPDGKPLIRLGLLNSGGQPVPPGALLNIIYPVSWNTFEGCSAEGLWVIGGPSIPSDEPLPDATQARLWIYALPNALQPGITNLLYFRVSGPAGRHQMIVRMAGTALSEAHLGDLPTEPEADMPAAEEHQDESGELSDIRLIQGEIVLGKTIVEAAIDVSQVYTTVADTQWRTHQA